MLTELLLGTKAGDERTETEREGGQVSVWRSCYGARVEPNRGAIIPFLGAMSGNLAGRPFLHPAKMLSPTSQSDAATYKHPPPVPVQTSLCP